MKKTQGLPHRFYEGLAMTRPPTPDEATQIRADIQQNSDRISRILEEFLNNDLTQSMRESLLSSYDKLSESNSINMSDDLEYLINSLREGTAPEIDRSSSKSGGEAWEVIFAVIIQSRFVDCLDEEIALNLNGRTPDLPELQLDLKKSTKEGGISSSTSSSESMVIDAFFQRLNGIEHDILMFRFDEIQSEAIVQEYFVERTQLVDETIYDLYKNAVEILCVDGFPPELSQLRSELLRELAHFLCLSRGKRIKFTFEMLSCVLRGTFGNFLWIDNQRYLRLLKDHLGDAHTEEREYIHSTRLNRRKEYYIERFDFDVIKNVKLPRLSNSFLKIVETGYFSRQELDIYSPILKNNDLSLQQQLILYMTPFIRIEYRKSTTIDEGKIQRLIDRIITQPSTNNLGKLTTKGLELHVEYQAAPED